MRELSADFRHAIRGLLKNPAFTLTVLATLTLAIGANIAIFTIANALILANLPVSRPDRLLEISTSNRGDGNLSIPAFQLLERRAGCFSSLFAWSGGGMENLQMNGAVFAGSVDQVGGDYYSTLGVKPALGRFFSQEESGVDHFQPSRVAIIGYRAWQERYHADPNVMGKILLLNGKPFTIIGVHPPSFTGLIREVSADATVPLTASAENADRLYDRTHNYFTVVGRLRDGISAAQASAQVETLWPAIRRETAPAGAPERDLFLAYRVRVQPAARGTSYLRARFARPLQLLFGIVALLLFLACVNLANVALARAQGRAAELSLRVALGASPWRLMRASLVECVVLAAAGAIPGLALAYWGSDQLMHFIWQGYVPLALSARPDTSVVLFTAAVAIASGIVFGMLPAWHAGRQDPLAAMQAANQRVAGGWGRAGRALVTIQIALSFAILAGALLFSRSLGNVARQDSGFRSEHLLIAQLFPRTTYKGVDKPAYFRQLLEALRSMPGVTMATIAHNRPIGMAWKKNVLPANAAVDYHLVWPGFFDTLGMRIVAGRDFTFHDDEHSPTVAIVSVKLARLLSPTGDAIGRRVAMGSLKTDAEVVGIASDAALDDPRNPETPAIYVAMLQNPDYLGWNNAIVRTPGDPVQLAHAMRQRIESLGREYPLTIETVGDELGRTLLPERLLALLTNIFGGLGLLLAAVGLYGLLSYSVARRTGEIGVRVALGATSRAIARMFLREVAALLAIGLAAGLAIALLGGRALSATLYGLSSNDPGTLAIAAAVLIGIALLAALRPALRAARVDPAIALRHE